GEHRTALARIPADPGAPHVRVEFEAEQAAKLTGERRWKAISRHVAYHGTTMGALSINGVASLRTPFEPLVPSVARLSHTGRFHRPPGESEEAFTAFLLDELERTIEQEGPETIAMVILEPVQNAGRAFTPPAGYFAGVRVLCDRHGILLCADEVISAFGRVGAWFGSERYDVRPDLITCAKGLSSAYGAIGAVIAAEHVAEPFLKPDAMFSHGLTFGGHPVQAAIALANLAIMRRERLVERVREQEGAFRATLEQLLELEIVGDVRGAGYFWAIELVKDRDTRTGFSPEEQDSLLRGFLSRRLLEAGLICRADDRGDPVLQLSPPLIAGQAQFDEIASILGDVLGEAQRRLR
ncbi:MAG TPA: aminotransferase class III-fold pyridoxal phosphate-dependent enzyme, partial [Conexibacter sp.]|nr:aminotransferase class III-fold pyridoxal phosphate-dependent enzyme [Conexibacter sp.]